MSRGELIKYIDSTSRTFKVSILLYNLFQVGEPNTKLFMKL